MDCNSTCELAGARDLIALNQSCFCMTLSRDDLDLSISEHIGADQFSTLLRARPNLFAATAIFISSSDLQAMQSQVHAIESVISLPTFQEAALARTQDVINSIHPRSRGLLMGYDFHISNEGPKLIEINTNAGGAFLVSQLQRAASKQADACGDARLESADVIDARLVESFVMEWHSAGRAGRPRRLGIVDENPTEQYLYPDMLIARDLLIRNGIETHILSPEALAYEAGDLMSGEGPIDMIYNRLTDFDLTEPGHVHLRQAILDDAVVMSPGPRHHVLYANKRNLIWLSNAASLESFGVDDAERDVLSSIPATRRVTEQAAHELWADRRNYFFKPAAGFGSRATYRGDKLTKRVWSAILEGDYIAQALVPPTMRAVTVGEEHVTLKYDVRLYTYAGATLLLAARLYQGQTTNFRTSGGGFAPVYQI